MGISKERIGAVFFLAFSIAYGYYAGEIKLLPGEEFEPMTARSLPYTLAALGVLLSIALLFSAKTEALNIRHKYEWTPVILLMLIALAYGLALDWLGFIISTIIFLIASFRTLGETRLKILLGISIPFVLIFWFGLTQMLDIYLAPGRLFAGLGAE